MKTNVLLPVLSLAMSIALLSLIKMRKKEYDNKDRVVKFQNIKLRVASEVLEEYRAEQSKMQDLLQKTQNNMKKLEDEIQLLETSGKNKMKLEELEYCKDAETIVSEQVATLKKEAGDLRVKSSKEKSSWETELAALKSEIAMRSKVCDYVKSDADVRNWCGDQVNKDAPKEQQAQAAVLKQQEAKAEAPKQQEAKAEAPKQQEAKAEAPKQQ